MRWLWRAGGWRAKKTKKGWLPRGPGQQHPRKPVTSVTSAVPVLTSLMTSIHGPTPPSTSFLRPIRFRYYYTVIVGPSWTRVPYARKTRARVRPRVLDSSGRCKRFGSKFYRYSYGNFSLFLFPVFRDPFRAKLLLAESHPPPPLAHSPRDINVLSKVIKKI